MITTFEDYLKGKDLKESTKKRYIKSWCSGKPIKTVENHYMKYMTFNCPGMTPKEINFHTKAKEFRNLATNLADSEYYRNVMNIGGERAMRIKMKRFNRINNIEYSNLVNNYNLDFNIEEVFK